ncbi:MAG: hypothetical protein KDD06_27850 [Phaeodactylibacter sp.]|nr:hypothetical protein [Phaeodactylibacter sp.]MCB9290864.1 hypothetical protein [Lewinellaceae bacterium]
MKSIPLSFLILLAILLMSTPLASQSGWAREKGSLYVQAAAYGFSSRDYYSVDGQLFDKGGKLTSTIYSIYGEYGLSSQLTIIGDLPVLGRNKFSNTNTVSGLGDFRLDLKYGVNQSKLPVSFSLGVELPTGQKDLFATAKEPNEFGIIERINLPTGDGEWNFLATVAVSRSFWEGKAYGSAFAAYNLRTQQYSGQVRLGAEVGGQPLPGLWLFGKLFTQLKGLEGSTDDVSFFRGEGTTFTRISFGGQYMLLEEWGVTASFFLPINDFITPFRNIYAAPAFQVGVVYQSR